jgi:2-methylcitrate dehydratase PrpD
MENTQKVIDFVVKTRLEDIPAAGLAQARIGILDCVGVGLAGARQPAGAISAEWARKAGSAPQATVWGQGFKTSAHDAALVNGTAAHALDYDDVTWGLIGHPSVSLVPAVFALGEQVNASGRDVLLAYAVGFEVMAKIGRTTQPAHSLEGGWHSTGTIGAFGATAACCKLLGLDAGQIGRALGIVYSMTSGNVKNFGTMCKPLHAGLAARNAVEAALWSELGFTSVPSPFDGYRNFHDVYSRGLPENMAPLAELGRDWELILRGVTVKPYPCGVALHPAIDAVLDLKARHKIDVDRIAKIEVGMTRYTYDKLSYLEPKTGLEAKFSMPFTVAWALVHPQVTLETFTDAAVTQPKILSLVRRTRNYVHDEIERKWKMGSRPVHVRLCMQDGTTLEKQVDISKGNPEVALTPEELRGKFEDCARFALADEGVRAAVERLAGIERLKSIRELTAVLAGADAGTQDRRERIVDLAV